MSRFQQFESKWNHVPYLVTKYMDGKVTLLNKETGKTSDFNKLPTSIWNSLLKNKR